MFQSLSLIFRKEKLNWNNMRKVKTEKFILRYLKKEDEEKIAEYANNKKIYQRTLFIPYPYGRKDARKWIKEKLKEYESKKPKNLVFGIEIGKEVVGVVGLHNIEEKHKAEIGYWLAEKYWGAGIMSKAVELATEFAFKKMGLRKIYASIFCFNKGSMRVLEKNSYKLEGVLKKHLRKDNKVIDLYFYAKIK